MYITLMEHNMFLYSDDHSRVKLQNDPNIPGSDYINASYIDVSSDTHTMCWILINPLCTIGIQAAQWVHSNTRSTQKHCF